MLVGIFIAMYMSGVVIANEKENRYEEVIWKFSI